MSEANWCTIESDPGVFTELVQKFGVKGVQVEEVFDMDHIDHLGHVHGFIFLFKWEPTSKKPNCLSDPVEGVFFAKQVINNACATQAIVSILLNVSGLELGNELKNFKEFTQELPFDVRGLALANSEVIRSVHNSFGHAESFEIDSSKIKDSEKEDAFHFVGYVPVGGNLYELDGLQPGPILHGPVSENDWVDKLKPVIRERIEAYQKSEQRFALLAVVEDKKEALEGQKAIIEAKIMVVENRIANAGDDDDMDLDGIPSNPDQLPVFLNQLKSEMSAIDMKIQDEVAKRERWHIENERRRFNYLPFAFAFLKVLAKKGKLDMLVEKAKKKQEDRAAARKKSG